MKKSSVSAGYTSRKEKPFSVALKNLSIFCKYFLSVLLLTLTTAALSSESPQEEVPVCEKRKADSHLEEESKWNDNIFCRSQDMLAEKERLKEKYKSNNPAIKYGPAGHLYTTYFVTKTALGDIDRAYEIAYFSQLPDEEKWFSATYAFFTPWRSESREIMKFQHALHGGDQIDVLETRDNLKRLIQFDESLKDYQIGLIIHAYADSYAHTTVTKGGRLKAYGYIWGHLWHGHDPDLIAYDPPKYREYTCDLFKALSRKNNCENAQMADLHDMIKKLEMDISKELSDFETYMKTKDFDENELYAIGSNRRNELSKKDIKATIDIIGSAMPK